MKDKNDVDLILYYTIIEEGKDKTFLFCSFFDIFNQMVQLEYE